MSITLGRVDGVHEALSVVLVAGLEGPEATLLTMA
jgi:hypothetical protein